MRFESRPGSTNRQKTNIIDNPGVRAQNRYWTVLYQSSNAGADGGIYIYTNDTPKTLYEVLNNVSGFLSGTPFGIAQKGEGYNFVRVVGQNAVNGDWVFGETIYDFFEDGEAGHPTTTRPESNENDDPDRRVYWLVSDEDQENGVAHKVATTAQDAAEQYFDDHYWRDEPEVGASIWVVREEDAKIFSFQTEEVECECEPEVELNISQTR